MQPIFVYFAVGSFAFVLAEIVINHISTAIRQIVQSIRHGLRRSPFEIESAFELV
ncbi:hypothetical protein [Novosphingobium rosa]|uniref:hypothetical protein n=1 Tax=Novosphingobium rosa TaxID=76978 RepID=UPI000A7671CC|nr:hypothetical protein [Novosphingobium rosa]